MLLTILIFLIVAVWQIPKMVKKKQYKDLAVFLLVWLGGGVYSVMAVLEVNFLDPMEMIHHGVEALNSLLGL